MSVYTDVQALELEIFKALEYCFCDYVPFRNYPKLKIALEAIRQLEIDYKSITKKNFVRKEVIDKLYTDLDRLKKTFDEDLKARNDLLKKYK